LYHFSSPVSKLFCIIPARSMVAAVVNDTLNSAQNNKIMRNMGINGENCDSSTTKKRIFDHDSSTDFYFEKMTAKEKCIE